MITVVLMYAALAASFTVAKIVVSYASPYFAIGFRMTLAGTIFLGLQYFLNKDHFTLKKSDLWLFGKTALFYIYLAFIPEFWSLQYLTSSKVVILYSVTPFIAAILAYFLVGERLTKQKVIGMSIGIGGMLPILFMQDSFSAQEILKISLPELALFVAIFAGAYGWFPVKQLMDRGYKLPMINGVTMLLGGIAALATSAIVEGVSSATQITQVGPFLLWILVLIVLSNGIFYNMYGWHLRRYSFTLLSFAGFLCPIFGSFYGWYFLSESITINHFISLGLVGIGLYVFYREELTLI